MEIKRLTLENIEDFLELLKVFEIMFEWESFEMPPKKHLEKMVSSRNFLVFVVKDSEQVIGGLTAHVLDRYDLQKPSAYIYDIAVLSRYQRLGTGKRIIDQLLSYCKENNFSEAFIQAEDEDAQV